MYPNPQDALPLPARPNIEQYKKLAKELVKSCRSGDPAAIGAWARHWIEALAGLQQDSDSLRLETEIEGGAAQVEQFARKMMSGGDGQSPTCVLADAQFVIARAHGFLSWPAFITHIESLARATSPVSAFEAAVHAIVTGDASTIRRLLREHPDLVRARSTREHRATLLHYVSANGVEGYRQLSPTNSAEIATILLEAGAEVDAGADVYGSDRCTTLGLVATSAPPDQAGVQLDVIDVLLEHGARTHFPGLAGHNHTLIRACLANGQPAAAAHLANRGAPLDLVGAAGLGRVDVLRQFFEPGVPREGASEAATMEGFWFACGYGQVAAAEFLLDHGVGVDVELRGHGEGSTGLHTAAYHGHLDVVDLLLRRRARVDIIDKTWRTPPLIWALTGWSKAAAPKAERYYEVVRRLVRAGAEVTPKLLDWDEARGDPNMLAALTAKT